MKSHVPFPRPAFLPAAVLALAAACGPGRAPEPEHASGRELYELHGCALCHGPEGRGDGPVAPTLDPRPRDLGDPTAYRIGPTATEIASTLEEGILVLGGSGMPSYAHIPAEDRRELARYIVSLQKSPPSPLGALQKSPPGDPSD
jgi:high-affinity iron transporter